MKKLILSLLTIIPIYIYAGEVDVSDYWEEGSFTCNKDGKLKKYLEDGGDPSAWVDLDNGYNLLMAAVVYCSTDDVRLLLEHGADKTINAQRRYSSSPQRAIELVSGVENTELLMQYGARVDFPYISHQEQYRGRGLTILEYMKRYNEDSPYANFDKEIEVIERYQNKISKQNSIVRTELSYSQGDRIFVLFDNGKKCKATVLMPGKEQSKIEYNGFCDVNFLAYKSDGEKQWAPNHALTSR